MSLTPGTRLGPFEVVAQIGVGGMGEVYRATDTNLKRQVAIKVLPEAMAADAERLSRFQREAEVLAALNHPNIAQIHGLERSDERVALVMELVEGQTVADRIAHGPMPVDEALPIARQIVEALDTAHEQGIIHRDLKPANVKVRDDGTVKVLDFGLAKAMQPIGAPGASPDLSNSPTIPGPVTTQAGLILGTAAYMSPEQARGKPVDKRADIWAFGVLLYEMLTGRRLFSGEDTTDTLARVVRDVPDLSAVPASVRRLLGQCLEKDPKQRLRDIGDVWRLIEERPPQVTARPAGSRLRWALAAAIAGGLATGLVVWALRRPEPRSTVRSLIPFAEGQTLTESAAQLLAISPDGTRIVYSADGDLWLRPLDRWEATRVSGTEDGVAVSPFFSADGEWIGFHSGGQLRKVPATGGAVVSVCSAGTPAGASWGADDMILYGDAGGVWRVPASGGTPEQVIAVADGESVVSPQALPGGEWVLLTLRPSGVVNWNEAQIVVQSLETGQRTVLIEGGHDARYVPTGHLVYSLNAVLMAVRFDPDARRVADVPTLLVDGVYELGSVTPTSYFALAANGTLVYAPWTSGASRLVWLNRAGAKTGEIAQTAGEARDFALSADEQRVAYWERDRLTWDIWVLNLARGDRTRVTTAPGVDVRPAWSPDGEWLAFTNQHDGIVLKRADGSGERTALVGGLVDDWSTDGRFILYEGGSGNDRDVWYLERSADGSSWEPHEYLATPANELVPKLSPDVRYLAYVSDESGRQEVHVRPFPDGGRQWTVSTNGGQQPLWSPDGSELFYLEGGARLMAVNVSTAGEFAAGTPQPLFEYPELGAGQEYPRYDVSSDGQRFVTVEPAADEPGSTLRVVQNALGELRDARE